MIIYLLITFLIAAPLPVNFTSPQQSSFKPAYKLKDVTEFGCCGIDLELYTLIEALRKEPEARAHLIGYSGPDDPPGKLLRHLHYMEINFPDFMADKSHPISVINGGQRDKFTIEMWIVPDGASVPAPSGLAFDMNSDARLPVKFDEAEAFVMEYKEESYLAFGLACSLTNPDWPEFFRRLRDKPNLRGHIIIYVGHDHSVRSARRIERFLRAHLTKYFAKEGKALTMVYGGKREWSQLEIWLVPAGAPAPPPTPRSKSSRAR
jgi:hypothetical protein